MTFILLLDLDAAEEETLGVKNKTSQSRQTPGC